MPTLFTKIIQLTLVCLLFITVQQVQAAPTADVQGQLSSSTAALPNKCREHLLTAHGTNKKDIEEGLQKELSRFRTLAEEALTLRAETISVGKRIKAQMDQKKPLSGDDLAILNVGITEHLKLRNELLEVAESHECWLDGSEQEWISPRCVA